MFWLHVTVEIDNDIRKSLSIEKGFFFLLKQMLLERYQLDTPCSMFV